MAMLSDVNRANRKYRDALASYDRALSLAPGDVWIQVNRGNALAGWGDLQAAESRDLAEANNASAVTTYDALITVAHDDVGVHENKETR